ncbi:MAG: ankyrin repeat domain-containing protein [Gammaproteobacteria bacterium]|nr:ankyrin repeat domain-containing protein [Gammaproteobacteria bacterium]
MFHPKPATPSTPAPQPDAATQAVQAHIQEAATVLPKFWNTKRDFVPKPPACPPDCPTTVADVRAIGVSPERLYYVITRDGLTIGSDEYPSAVTRVHPMGDSGPMEFQDMQRHHHDMAHGAPVYGAGEIWVQAGKIIQINNNSGHYKPRGDHLKEFVETTFRKAGYAEAVNIYQENRTRHSIGLARLAVDTVFIPMQRFGHEVVTRMQEAASRVQRIIQLDRDTAASMVRERALNPARPIHHLMPVLPSQPVSYAPRPSPMNTLSRSMMDLRASWSASDIAFRQRTEALKAFGRQPTTTTSNFFYSTLTQSYQMANRDVQNHYKNMLWQLPSGFKNVDSSLYLKIHSLAYNGLGSTYASGFSSLLRATGLGSSYNGYHPFASIYTGWGMGEIGGVATKVATIVDLIDSRAHAWAEDYVICLPIEEGRLPFTTAQLKQISRELANAFFKHKTLPFFSLHFNSSGYLYPVIHPAFQHTLVGKVIGLLDYFMKGFLNGGVYRDEDFLKHWPEGFDCNEANLKTFVTDLKAFCKANCKEVHYTSLRELMSRHGIKEEEIANGEFTSPYETSYRIISRQGQIKRYENILVADPIFDVEYSVDINPAYQAYLDRYHAEHGKYPDNFSSIKTCYAQYAEEIKQKMPKLPFCRDLFQMLGVINFLCYFYMTLDKMGKVPTLEQAPIVDAYEFPKALPPIPIRYTKFYPLEVYFEDVFEEMARAEQADSSLTTTNHILKDMLTKPFGFYSDELDNHIKKALAPIISAKLMPLLQDHEDHTVNDDEIEIYADGIRSYIINDIQRQKKAIARIVSQIVKFLPDKEIYLALPPAEQISRLLEDFTKLREQMRAQIQDKLWRESKILCLSGFGASLRRKAEQMFEQLEASIHADWDEAEPALSDDAASTPENVPKTLLGALSHQCKTAIAEEIREMVKGNREAFAAQVALIPAERKAEFQQEIEEQRAELEAFIKTTKQLIIDDKLRATLLSLMLVTYENALQHIDDKVSDFSGFFSDKSSLTLLNSSKKYLHSTFTTDSTQITGGKQFKVVGGCGMALPNMRSMPIVDGENFAMQAFGACSAESETFSTAHIAGSEYAVFKMRVEDRSLTDTLDFRLTDDMHPVVQPLQVEEQLLTLSTTPETLPPTAFLQPLDETGARLVHFAVGDLGLLQQLIERDRSQLQLRNDYGQLCIHSAVLLGQVEAINYLLTQDSSLLNAITEDGSTPLMLAAMHGNFDVIQCLLSHAAEVHTRQPNGLFALYMAIQNNFNEIALAILDAMTDVNLQLDNHMTALHLSIEMKLFEVARRLIEKGARCDLQRKSDGFTAFHCAVKAGQIDLVEAMLSGGIAVDFPLESKKTALHIATEHGQVAMVNYLLAHGANVDAEDQENETALTTAIRGGEPDLALLLAKKSKINRVNQYQQTASLQAAQYGLSYVADELIKRGEDPCLLDQHGHHYFYYLLRNGDEIRFLRILQTEWFLKLNVLFDGSSLLALAAQNGHFLIVDELIKKNALFKTSKEGYELIHFAVMNDAMGFVRAWLRDHESSEGTIQSGHDAGQSLGYLAALNSAKHTLTLVLNSLTADDVARENILLAALYSQDVEILEQVMTKVSHINASMDSHQNTAIHLAVKFGCAKFVEALLRYGATPTLKNKSGRTSYHIAIQQEDAYLLEQLLKLTREEEWPADLWQFLQQKPSDPIARVLRKLNYQADTEGTSARLTDNTTSLKTQAALKIELQRHNDSQFENIEQVCTQAARLLKHGILDDLYFLLKQYPQLICAYRSTPEGRYLLADLFAHMPALFLIKDSAGDWDDDSPRSQLEKLLLHIKEANINPADYQGVMNNVIFTVLRSTDEEDACAKLDLWMTYFPESLSVLVNDPVIGKFTVADIALHNGRQQFFLKIAAHANNTEALDQQQFHPFHEAIMKDQYDLVMKMMDKYPINGRNNKQQTPLICAAMAGNVYLMRVLLAHGADPLLVDNEGNSALHYAIATKSLPCALCLLPLMRDKHRANRAGMTPFHQAAKFGLLPVMRLIGVSGTEQSVNGYSALHTAAMEGQTEVIEFLVNQGCNINKPLTASSDTPGQDLRSSPLHIAAAHGKIDAVIKLIRLGAFLEQEDADGDTVFEHAVASKNSELVRVLQESPHYYSSKHDNKLLFAAARFDNTDVLMELLSSDVNINATSKDNLTALHFSALENAVTATRLLLIQGISVFLKDKAGFTALHFASENGHVAIIDLLMKYQAPVNEQNNAGMSAMHLACKNGQVGAVSALLRHQPDLTLENTQGKTAKQIAQDNGKLEIVGMIDEYLHPPALMAVTGRFRLMPPPAIGRAIPIDGSLTSTQTMQA